jgi:hypothetical protein
VFLFTPPGSESARFRRCVDETPPLAANQTPQISCQHMSDRRSPAQLSSSLPPMARCSDGPLRATAEVRPCQG